MMGGELTYQRLLQIIETGMIPFNNPVMENERLKFEIEQLRSQPATPFEMTKGVKSVMF